MYSQSNWMCYGRMGFRDNGGFVFSNGKCLFWCKDDVCLIKELSQNHHEKSCVLQKGTPVTGLGLFSHVRVQWQH
jgi:hypothetical protein